MFKLLCPSKFRSINSRHTHRLSSVLTCAKFKLAAAVEGVWWGKKAILIHLSTILLMSWQQPQFSTGMTYLSLMNWNKHSYHLAFWSVKPCPLHIAQNTRPRLVSGPQFPISITLLPLHWGHNSCSNLWLTSQINHTYFSQASFYCNTKFDCLLLFMSR